jgi:hypothetical protein
MRRATTTSHTPRDARCVGVRRDARCVGVRRDARYVGVRRESVALRAAARCAGMACAPIAAAWRAVVAAWLCCVLLLASAVQAQGVDLAALELKPSDGALTLEFSARLTLSRAIEDALRRGVPMYFEIDATLYRSRWYWRDERVSHIARSYRLSYQPLTGSWRVGLGPLGQSYPTLSDAMAVISRVSGWRLAEAAQLDNDQRYYVEFNYRLDTSQLPQPLQLGVGNDWSLGTARVLRVDESLIEAVRR